MGRKILDLDFKCSKCWTPEAARVARGSEKGRFEFGGSTIVVVLPRRCCVIDADILENSRAGIETKVKYGERIGCKETCCGEDT